MRCILSCGFCDRGSSGYNRGSTGGYGGNRGGRGDGARGDMIVGGITTTQAEVEIMIIEVVGMVMFLLHHPVLIVAVLVEIIHLLLMHMMGIQIMEWMQFLLLQAILVDPHHTLRLMVALQVVMVAGV